MLHQGPPTALIHAMLSAHGLGWQDAKPSHRLSSCFLPLPMGHALVQGQEACLSWVLPELAYGSYPPDFNWLGFLHRLRAFTLASFNCNCINRVLRAKLIPERHICCLLLCIVGWKCVLLNLLGSWNQKASCEDLCWQRNWKEKGWCACYLSEGTGLLLILKVLKLIFEKLVVLIWDVYRVFCGSGTFSCFGHPNFGWYTSTAWWQESYVS